MPSNGEYGGTVVNEASWRATILNMIVTSEGGYVDHPADRGGPTNWGITMQALAEFLDLPKVEANDIRMLSIDKAVEIYLKKYVVASGIADLDPRLHEIMLDSIVNHGPAGGVKMLQRAIGEVEDGRCGPRTLAVANARPLDAYYGIIRSRMKKYAGIVSSDPGQLVFLPGWINRLSRFTKAL
jgi:lysozyme family protein